MKKIIPIINLAAKLASVNRTIGYRKNHFENDAEHSYQLAMVCWAVNEQYDLELNDGLILKLALAHDLVEVYAGDTDAFDDKNKIANKKENEQKALETLKTDFPNFKELPQIIEKYEKQSDIEAQLVYVMDKFIADANIYYSAGDYYKSRKIDQKIWKKWLLSKIDLSKINPKLNFLVSESIEEIETKFRAMFYEVE
jgi:putative hydrolase of HD superfamily